MMISAALKSFKFWLDTELQPTGFRVGSTLGGSPDYDIHCLVELAPGSTLLTITSLLSELSVQLGREVD